MTDFQDTHSRLDALSSMLDQQVDAPLNSIWGEGERAVNNGLPSRQELDHRLVAVRRAFAFYRPFAEHQPPIPQRTQALAKIGDATASLQEYVSTAISSVQGILEQSLGDDARALGAIKGELSNIQVVLDGWAGQLHAMDGGLGGEGSIETETPSVAEGAVAPEVEALVDFSVGASDPSQGEPAQEPVGTEGEGSGGGGQRWAHFIDFDDDDDW
ncbi:MAG: hypothetical protein AAGF11_12630 [Myxococcota bacterium]